MKVNDLEIMDAIDAFIAEHGYCPSFRDLSDALGIGISATKHRLDRMRRDKLVTFEDGKARTIRVVR